MPRFENSLAFARKLDHIDPLKKFRSKFHLPKSNGKTAIYFTGNSLGLQPKSAAKFIRQELKDWATLGVEGHFHAHRPWLNYHKLSKKFLGKLIGAKPIEVVAMNQLTVNLHLMMVSFYRPTKTRFKILTEAGAFPSDQYAFESQVKFHGFNPDELYGIYCGYEGSVHSHIGFNTYAFLSWKKMEVSGRYEVTAYVG